jgi:hypothetical protein
MNGAETDVRRTGRRRRLTLGALLALVATLAATTMVANPASAAAVCGNWVIARVSIHYKACNAPGPSTGTIRITGFFLNNHGAGVDLDLQSALKANGRMVGTDWAWVVLLWYPDRPHQRLDDAVMRCQSGVYTSYALRIKENDGSAGPWSVAPPVRCP